jgi:ABC-type transport system substrate-binding protein
VEAIPNHWRKTSSIKFVDYQIVPEYATQLALVATAKADIINLTASQVNQARRVGSKIVVDDAGYNVWYALRGQIPESHKNYDGTLPWVDGKDPERAKKVRLALNLAIDRQGIINRLYGGIGQVSAMGACTFPGQPWYYGDPYPYDSARAKALLAEAGYANGFDLEIPLYDQASGPVGLSLHDVVADQWRQIGVKVKTVPAEFTVFREILLKIEQPKLTYYWYCNFSDPDPMRYYNFFYHVANPVWFGSAALEPMLDKANAGLTSEQRKDPIIAINKYFRDNHYWVPMFVLPKMYATSQRIDKWPLVSGHLRVHNIEYMTLAP